CAEARVDRCDEGVGDERLSRARRVDAVEAEHSPEVAGGEIGGAIAVDVDTVCMDLVEAGAKVDEGDADTASLRRVPHRGGDLGVECDDVVPRRGALACIENARAGWDRQLARIELDRE